MGNPILEAIRETAAGILNNACEAGTALPEAIKGIGNRDPKAALDALSDGASGAANLADVASGGAGAVGRRIAGAAVGGAAQDWLQDKGIPIPDLTGGHKCLTSAFDAAAARKQLPEAYRAHIDSSGPAAAAPTRAPGLGN